MHFKMNVSGFYLLLINMFVLAAFANDNMNQEPSFINEPPSRVEFSNSSGTVIPCTADGRPHPVVSWVKHDGDVIRDLPGLRHTRHDGSLVFSAFSPEDYRADVHASVYRCEATNIVGTIGSRDVQVNAVVIQKYDIRLFDEFVLRGNTAVVRCPIPSSVTDYVKVISWERIDGFIINENSGNVKYGMLDNGDLYLHEITDNENLLSFRCHTENTITKEKKVSTNYSRIIVTEPHHSQPPRILQRSSIVTVPTGSKAVLSCIAQGHPAPLYRWHKLVGNQPVSIPISSSIRQEAGVLIFLKTTVTDSGRYACHVNNTMGEDSVQTELIVEEPLHVSISPKEMKMDVGRTATFTCNISGSPFSSVIWKKDMRELSSNPRAIFPTPYVIQMKQLKRQDSGMYQCFVYREGFSVQASARLVIGDLAPKLKSVFSEKTIRPGSFVSLACVATGNPEPHIRWALDSIWPLSTRPGILVSSYLSAENTITSYLNFTSVDIIDSGLYTCEAINDAGNVLHMRRLNVFGPVFIRPLDNLTAVAGATFYMMCPFGGFPFDSITWKRNGKDLPINQRQRVFQNGTLQISDVQPVIDSGQYSCAVSSGQGMQPAIRTFRIIIRAGPKIANFAFRDNLHEGMRTAVTCIVIAGDGPVVTKWFKDGRPIFEEELGVKIMQEDEGFISTLTFKNLTYKHNGNYTCISTNDVASGTSSALLLVKVPPRWLLEPEDISTVAGRPARIDCQADGVPQPHVRWKMASNHPSEQFQTIVSSSHIHILMNGSLNFRSVDPSDAGRYLCEANNGVGVGLSAVAQLTVHSAPHFLTKFSVVSTKRGGKAVLECFPEGDIPMSFLWKRNGSPIDLSKEPRYTQTTNTVSGSEISTLIIEKAERKDSALITCTASNAYGEDSVNIQVTVQDIPDAPQNLEIHDVSSRTVRLSWKRPFDGNFPITRFTIKWRQMNGELTGGPLHVPGSETTLIIRGLRPKTRYFFRVKCENTLGESQFGAEVAVTTLEEPPTNPPQNVRATAVSSKSVNITWQSNSDDLDSIDGYYVGYKLLRSSEPYTFKPVSSIGASYQYFEVKDLSRYTEYSFVVQAYNSRGAGPPSEETIVRTLEFDRPYPPIIKSYFATSKTLKLSWEPRSHPNAPVSGYILRYKMDEGDWQETHVTSDHTFYTLHDLQCGTTYSFYLVAFNSAGRGNGSEILSAKTDGSPPIAPDKRLLLSVNSTTVVVNLNSWHNGGCPIRGFVIQYRASGQQEWTLVSNNVIPEQHNITITDLVAGSWYSLLMTARNDAGATDAEYIFATLTLSGELPPRPSKVSDVSGSFYRHLTITVPVVSSIIVVLAVLCAVCFITQRRSSGLMQRPTNADTDSSYPIKAENVPLSVTYGQGHEATYIPTPYATSGVSGYNREHCILPPPENDQNIGTFGSTRSGYSYNVPNPSRQVEKEECIYESPKIYYPRNRHSGMDLRSNQDHPIYEVPDRSAMKIDGSISWSDSRGGGCNTISDNEDLMYTFQSSDDRIIRDEARESETECDRLWKTFESNEYEDNKRWTNEHTVTA